jgi:tetratricopeptide (TPR) repeat protein
MDSNDTKAWKEAVNLYCTGEKYRKLGAWNTALDYYMKAIARVPDRDFSFSSFSNTWHHVGLVLLRLHRPIDAMPYLYRALWDYEIKRRERSDAFGFSLARVYALLEQTDKMFDSLTLSFNDDDRYVSQVYETLEFESYYDDREFQQFVQAAIARVKRTRTEFSVDELKVMGCPNCRTKARSTDGHDWTMICRQCGNSFSYGGCSCDGCCGGTYAGFGGGKTTYYV